MTCDVLSDAGAGHLVMEPDQTMTEMRDPRDVSDCAPLTAREVQCNQQVMNMRKLGTFLSKRRAPP